MIPGDHPRVIPELNESEKSMGLLRAYSRASWDQRVHGHGQTEAPGSKDAGLKRVRDLLCIGVHCLYKWAFLIVVNSE